MFAPDDAAAMLSDFGAPVTHDGAVLGRGVLSRVLVTADEGGMPVQRLERTLRVLASVPLSENLRVSVGRESVKVMRRIDDPDDMDGTFAVWAVGA